MAVPKTFAWAAGSLVSGYLLTPSSFGWPLVIGAVIEGVYDILLLIKFRKVRPPDEARAAGKLIFYVPRWGDILRDGK